MPSGRQGLFYPGHQGPPKGRGVGRSWLADRQTDIATAALPCLTVPPGLSLTRGLTGCSWVLPNEGGDISGGLYVYLIKRHEPTLISTHAGHLHDSSTCKHPMRWKRCRDNGGQVRRRSSWHYSAGRDEVKCKGDPCLADSDDLVRGPWQKEERLGVTTVTAYTGLLTSHCLKAEATTSSLGQVSSADTGTLANEHQRACPSTSNEDRWWQYRS